MMSCLFYVATISYGNDLTLSLCTQYMHIQLHCYPSSSTGMPSWCDVFVKPWFRTLWLVIFDFIEFLRWQSDELP